MAEQIRTYDIFAPKLSRHHDGHPQKVAAAMLGRRWFRWVVYREQRWDGGHLPFAWARVSEHWTRRAAWRASSRLRFEGEPDA